MTDERAIPTWRRVLRAIGRAIVIVAVVIYTLLDDLLFPLFRPLIRRLGELRLFQRLGDLIASLPPYAVLVLLAVPFVILEPAKLFAVYRGATGHVVQGTALLLVAHALSLLVSERLFHAGYEPLMRIGWFKALLDWLFGLRDLAINWAKGTTAWQAAAGWVRGVREWLRGVLASLR
ncbi:MAG: hypothetical protein JWQ89_2986 [Devosia sp.]|uniref:hypothetical protein n=1 Tax=Devosia sp. TaxID=1871048 RepID=UPI00262435B1|nr:hypothetical protein [Devosia sp.]MDB5541259.1 hypothetical protein [Devosia sp.]